MTSAQSDVVMRNGPILHLSVVVPCRNEAAFIEQFVYGLSQQQGLAALSWEVIVADGRSDDGTYEKLLYCQQLFPNLRIIENPEGIVSTGLNAAIRTSRGGVIARMDVHTVYAPDYLANCLRVLRETNADSVGGPWIPDAHGLIGRANALAFRSPFCTGGARSHDPAFEGRVDTVYLGCWRREIFDRFGYFDPMLVRNQDDEFHFRICKAGGTIWQAPSIVSRYSPRCTLVGLFRQYMQYGYWKVLVMRKHGGVASWRHLAPGLSVTLGSVLLALAGVGSVTGVQKITMWSAMLMISATVLYGTMSLVYAAACFGREHWRVVCILPLVFAVYHVSYGFGFMLAVLQYLVPGIGGRRFARRFSETTR
jgi:succinoglycan biosynthesis protein ExoA